MNHGISESLMRSALQRERMSLTPAPSMMTDEERAGWDRKTQDVHNHSMKAVGRIVDLDNASVGERKKAVIANCVNVFGRHQTDQFLPPKPRGVVSTDPLSAEAAAAAPVPATASELPGFERRVGPDTGSSEVQIAILTTKIRTLANALREHGGPDKMNKRNLRLLVHKRAKLLKYLRRKERGGPRWQHCIETLGLTDATWKYEITDLKL